MKDCIDAGGKCCARDASGKSDTRPAKNKNAEKKKCPFCFKEGPVKAD